MGLGAYVGLSDRVPLGVADGDGLVITAQGQQVLTAPLTTRDLLCVLAQDGNLATKNIPKVEILLQQTHQQWKPCYKEHININWQAG